MTGTLTAPVRKGDSIKMYVTNDDTSIWFSKRAVQLRWRPYGEDSGLAGFSMIAEE
ncbi:hypothetical protein [Streptomyces nondiastaticus]|uniref:Uncharacterized protein n=1 Tax=Streptomyces nondiastaticus TaxID=3154512 RepID=A0ABW6U315_9ACTN